MFDHAAEVLLEVLPTVVYAVAAVFLTGLGLGAELSAPGALASGETFVALWEAWIGLVALYAGVYVVGYGRLLPAVRGT